MVSVLSILIDEKIESATNKQLDNLLTFIKQKTDQEPILVKQRVMHYVRHLQGYSAAISSTPPSIALQIAAGEDRSVTIFEVLTSIQRKPIIDLLPVVYSRGLQIYALIFSLTLTNKVFNQMMLSK